jgi:hypothetical protein
MMYSAALLEHNIQVDPSLQLPPQALPQYADSRHLETEQAIIRNVEQVKDVLPLLNNHILLESMIMKDMTPLQDKPFQRLIPGAYLYSFIRLNQRPIGSSFNRKYLQQISLYSYALKVLYDPAYPGCESLPG